MPVTGLEIIDTAVKIGLGGLITGAFGFLLARISYRNDLGKEFAKRRRDSLEALAAQFLKTHKRLDELSFQTSDQGSVSRSETWDKYVSATRDEFSDVESQLLLLGERDAADALVAYIRTANKILYHRGELDFAAQLDVRQELGDGKLRVYEALGAAYRRNG